MNNYIINPILVYFANILNELKYFFILGSGLGIIIIGVCFLAGELDKIKYINFKKIFISLVICLIITMFIPNKNTVIEMIIAKTITMDTLNMTVDQIKEIINYIILAF